MKIVPVTTDFSVGRCRYAVLWDYSCDTCPNGYCRTSQISSDTWRYSPVFSVLFCNGWLHRYWYLSYRNANHSSVLLGNLRLLWVNMVLVMVGPFKNTFRCVCIEGWYLFPVLDGTRGCVQKFPDW